MFRSKLDSYPNLEASLGREIACGKIRRRKVWVAIGPARDVFEQEIVPEIKARLQKIDLGHADLFVKLYMIGKKPESANPILMLCCTDVNAAKEAEATVRESGVLEKHEGFGLGIIDLPLEHPGPVRRLLSPPPSPNPRRALQFPPRSTPTPPPSSISLSLDIPSSLRIIDFDSLETPGSSRSATYAIAVFALSSEPRMGRRIFTADGSRGPAHFATAGIILHIGGDFYQVTVGHLFESENDVSDAGPPPVSSGYCYFDGQSDDEDCDSDQDTKIESSDNRTSKDLQSNEQLISDPTGEGTSGKSRDDMLRHLSMGSNEESEGSPSSTSKHTSQNREIMRSYDTSKRIPIGYYNGTARRFPIDYAIIALPYDSVKAMDTRLNLIPGYDHLYVTGIAGISEKMRDIIVVTSSGVIHGELLPGSVAYRSHNSFFFQKLFQISLQEPVFEGDCGSPVLDRLNGNLYGHITMGVAGTNWAYIMPGTDIVQHLTSSTGNSVQIATLS